MQSNLTKLGQADVLCRRQGSSGFLGNHIFWEIELGLFGRPKILYYFLFYGVFSAVFLFQFGLLYFYSSL